MEMLDLWDNRIDDEGAEALCKCLHKIQWLDLTRNNITQVGEQAIRSVLARDDVVSSPFFTVTMPISVSLSFSFGFTLSSGNELMEKLSQTIMDIKHSV